MSNTKVFIDEFKGYPIFAVWEIDDNENKKGSKPIISFGLKKAKSIINHLGELKEWVSEEDEKRSSIKNREVFKKKTQAPAVTIDLNKLNKEQLKSFKKFLDT